MKLQLDTTGEVIKKWQELGYETDMLQLLPFVPLLQVAWAEGFLQAGEKRAILELFNELEIKEDKVFNELILHLNERPSEDFFTSANDILSDWLNTLPENQSANLRKFLHLGCLRVASASSRISLIPDKNSICHEEKRQLEQIGNRFGFSLA